MRSAVDSQKKKERDQCLASGLAGYSVLITLRAVDSDLEFAVSKVADSPDEGRAYYGGLLRGGCREAESKLKGESRSIRMEDFLSWGQFFT